MTIIVMKFGGTSVADTSCIKNVAKKVQLQFKKTKKIVVVVSAMAGTTNKLIEHIADIDPFYNSQEYDVVVSSGEQITAGLLAIALKNLGITARSWMGWQIPIITDKVYSKASIEDINVKLILDSFLSGQVAIVPGFQGINKDNLITTLGRGGSDLSAVALAAALKAHRCDIYTDVDGIYTADPRMVPKAKKLDRISFEEMMEMASQGAKVLQTRSVAMAMRHNVRLRVLSSFDDGLGTLVADEEEIMEKNIVSGIAFSLKEAKVTVLGIPDRPGQASKLFGQLAKKAINVDMIVQSSSADGNETDLSFTVPELDINQAILLIKEKQKEIGFKSIIEDKEVAKISVIGAGMQNQSGTAQKLFDTLAEKSINLKVISTSEIKISVLIDKSYMELAVRSLHTAFDLDV